MYHITITINTTDEEQRKAKKKKKFLITLINSVIEPFFIAAMISVYILISAFCPNMMSPSGFTPWAYLWPIIFLSWVVPETMRAIVEKKITLFPIWALTLFFYLFFGFYFVNGWAIYWPFWLMLPIFYLIAGSIEKAIRTFKEYKNGDF